MRERELERKLVQIVRSEGGQAYKFVSPGQAGVPDRLIVLPNGIIGFAELKVNGNTTSAIQNVQIKKLKKLGCFVEVIDSEEKIYDFVGRLLYERKV